MIDRAKADLSDVVQNPFAYATIHFHSHGYL